MFKNPVYKQAAKNLAFIVLIIVLAGLSQGLWLGVMTIAGVVCALSNKPGKALGIYLMIICMVDINWILLPAGNYFGILLRFGPLLIGLALMFRGLSSGGQSRVPLGMLLAFLLVATISSIDGWAPKVSYLKLLNFIVFLLGFWFGLSALGKDFSGIDYLRATFLAYSVFLIFGSAVLLPFPGISTLSGIEVAMREGNVEAANIAMLSAEGNIPLFCGVTRQSQSFAVQAALSVAWLTADMLFIEKRFSKIHLSLIITGIFLLYLSSSRTGLFSLMVGMLMVAVWLPNKIMLPPMVKRHLKTGVSVMLVLGFIGAVFAEISNDSISHWLRKTEDVDEDTRSLSEAVTASRQVLVDASMRDFRLNPTLGCGFQVAENTAQQIAKSGSGLVISAPIEKGVLPIMVLGETGIVGAIVFVIFLISFYTTSCRRKLYVTTALFTVLLATNMGEATFFSPGGSGGLLWTISIIGGYCIDMQLARERKYAYIAYN